jgi:hypothetical protein
MNIAFRVVMGAVSLLPLRAVFAQDATLRVAVSVDVTEQGRGLVAPTPERPVSYVPLSGGYKELGAILPYDRRPPPAEAQVLNQLVKTLSGRGYRLANAGSPATLVLVARWGYVAPQTSPVARFGPGALGSRPFSRITNREEVMAYVIGDKWPDLAVLAARRELDPPTQELFDSIRDATRHNGGGTIGRGARYYLLVSAFDAQAFVRNTSVLLWRAHMSTEAWGRALDEVLPTLVAAGAPLLGKDTARPSLCSLTPVSWAPVDKPAESELSGNRVANPPEGFRLVGEP